MTEAREKLLRILIETKAFQFSSTPTFRLASGAMSQFYVDCKVGLSYPEARSIVGDMILELVPPEAVAVGGLLVGAYPIAIAVSDSAYRASGRILRVFAVRKEAKAHGTQRMIEGDVHRGDEVVIVDDVITSGGSTIEAIKKSRDEGLIVNHAVAIIDREEKNGRASIEQLGVDFRALCTLGDLKALAQAAKA